MLGGILVLVSLMFTVVIMFVGWNSKAQSEYRELLRKIPGDLGLPLVGSLLSIGNWGNHIRVLNDLVSRHGKICKIALGSKICIILSDAKDVEIIYKDRNLTNHDKLINNLITPMLGCGLIASEGNTWKEHRKIINPMFNNLNLQYHSRIITEKGELLTEKLLGVANGEQCYIFDIIAETTLETALLAMMSVDVKTLKNTGREFIHSLTTAQMLIEKRAVRPWIYPNVLFERSQIGKETQAARNVLRDFCRSVFHDRRSALESTSSDTNDNKYSLLDHLIEHSRRDNGFSEDEVIDEVITLISAGYDTTATTMCSALVYLGLYPQYQEKVYEELKMVLGDVNRKLTMDDVPHMEYLERVIKETLRLSPPVVLISREIHRDTKLTNHTVPGGTMVFIFVRAVHRNPEDYPDPDVFDPDRFLPEKLDGRRPFSFIPFSGGNRNCIGHKYAMLQMKIFLANILKRYRILPGTTLEDMEKLEVTVISKPTAGFQVGILPRQTSRGMK